MYAIHRKFGVLSPTSFLYLSRQNLPFFPHQLLRAPYSTTRKFLGNTSRNVRNLLYTTKGPTQLSSSSVSIPNVSYRIGVAFSAKNTRFNPNTDLFSFDSTKEYKKINTGRPRSGQDAYFVSKVASGNNVAFGVADGVGGWIESGIDSAHVSHGLCKYMAESVKGVSGTKNKIRARAVLQKGYEGVMDDTSISGGGSTACVAIASSEGHIEVANLGDSGFVQLRLNAIHHYSNPQTHAFNTPYQLSVVSPKRMALSRIFGGAHLMDFPKDANITSHQVRNGDVLVFGTDGVWDNLSSNDLLKIVSRQMQSVKAWVASEKGISVSDTIGTLTTEGSDHSLQTRLATAITKEAKMASLNSIADGPFARQAQRYYPYENFHGGKVDDICVIVAVVVSVQPA